jgi:hypothetical protein
MLEILKPYAWTARDPDDSHEVLAKNNMENSLREIVVQICLTHMFVSGSQLSHVIVPETMFDMSLDHLSCFFKFVSAVGARNHCKLLQVSHVKDEAHDVYNHAVAKEEIHPIFLSRSGLPPIRNGREPTVYAAYRLTDATDAFNEEDPLFRYILSMPASELVGFPAYLSEEEISACELLNACAAHGFAVFLEGREGEDNRFISHAAMVITGDLNKNKATF